MARLKHLLEIERGIKAFAPGAQITQRRGRKHIILGVQIGERTKTFSVSSSPTSPEYTVRNALREITQSFDSPCRPRHKSTT